MKTWLFIRSGVVIAVECCVDKPPETMVDGQPATVFDMTLTFRFGQNVSTASPTTLLTGSFLEYLDITT